MTLRYAHLGPDQKREAVALLCGRRDEWSLGQNTPSQSGDDRVQEAPASEYLLPLASRRHVIDTRSASSPGNPPFFSS